MSNKYPTYKTLEDLPTDLREKLEKEKVVEISPSFNSKYMLVYGTLRWGCSNWSWCFNDRTKHIGTYELKGFLKSRGISCQYTGNPEHTTVFDLFEINEDSFMDVNEDTDSLEGVGYGYAGGYRSTAVLIDGKVAKFYNSVWTGNPDTIKQSPQKDYAVDRYLDWVNRSLEYVKLWKENAPQSFEFYVDQYKTEMENVNSKIEQNDTTTV